MALIDQFRETESGRPENVVMYGQEFDSADFSGGKIDWFSVDRSVFRNCDFRKVRVERASWGGAEWTVFEDCVFDGSRIRFNGVINTRFQNCSFQNVILSKWDSSKFELIGCTFSGRLRSCMFKGRSDSALNAPVNVVLDNDFSGAEFIDSDFRWGVDLTRQKLPEGLSVFYAEDSAAAITAAQARVPLITDPELRERVDSWLDTLTMYPEAGQKQLFVTARTFSKPGWPTLRAVLAGDDPNDPPRPPAPTPKKKTAKKTTGTRKKAASVGARKPESSAGTIDSDVAEWGGKLAGGDKAGRQEAADSLTALLRDPSTSGSRRAQAAQALAASLPDTEDDALVANLAGAILPASTVFTNTHFAAGSVFTGATAEGDLTFAGCVFHGPVDLTDLTVNGTTTITGCVFNRPTDFGRAEFNGPADFTGTRFESMANFTLAQFNDSLDLTDVQFWGDTSLEADFTGPVTFRRTMFQADTKKSIPLEFGYENHGLPEGTIWGPGGPGWLY
ncbi:pentapeptide repeat-containing protein [Propionibacterium australiense]|uniref:Pentapeptide repeat n=1 Tax=Propionibacterium australiense TaxID=119981 RepID=A0A383S6L9_9ACTN|nr:pentapeptide repeat-containing protein [Propionibacterium australiense]RLP06015.1 hypothetical protein D7U36_13275 [Propionibacterium australiense]RLP08496.1 hypothetical protein D9T14_08415 [Propionibacterium australiense]SYZ33655.1 Pentapeptide repeat [Propionibacterium australiense]VEH88880.1 Uncharacterised protein [Propionibacterium australiense]